MKDQGIPCDTEPFVPHITLIRRTVSGKPYQLHLPKTEMMVKKVSLMKSVQKNGSVVYKEL